MCDKYKEIKFIKFQEMRCNIFYNNNSDRICAIFDVLLN